MEQLALPHKFDADSAFTFANDLRRWDTVPVLTVDFSAVDQVEPFGLLFIAAALKACFKRRDYRGIAGASGLRNGHPAHEYLAHIGILKWLGIPAGVAPTAAQGTDRWLPLTVLTREELQARMTETGKPLGAVIQTESDRLARLLTQTYEFKTNSPLAYCFREVIRNVFEHAATDRCLVCAQRLRDGTTELAILDQGRGIRASLSEKFALDTDSEALRLALQPGVSRSLCTDPENKWGNSGFGLYVLSELGKGLGSFIVTSGEGALLMCAGREEMISTQYDGTAIQLRLKRPKGINFGEYIDRIITRGEQLTASTEPRRASASTRSVR